MGIKSKVLELASKAGQAQRLMYAYESLGGELKSSKIEVSPEIRDFRLDENERKGYILFPLIPGYESHCIRFCVLGHAFRVNGYEPILLRDDDCLPGNPGITVDNKDSLVKEVNLYTSGRYPAKFGMEIKNISDVLDRECETPRVDENKMNDIQPYEYRGMDLSGCVAASTRRYLRRYRLDMSDTEVQETYMDFLRSGILLADATQNIINQYDVEVAVVSEAAYIQGKIPLELCHKEGIKAYSQKFGYHAGECVYGNAENKNPMSRFSNEELTKRAVNKELSKEEKEQIKDLMQKRESGEVTRLKYTSDKVASVDVPEDKIAGVFCHLPWDAALEPEQAIYGNFYDWLKDTIEIGKNIKDTHFVIKAHPAENIHGTNESVVEWINKNYSLMPDNFTILPPDTDVNTYELIKDLDVGVVYASTVGLEMAFNCVPVLVGGFPPYHGFGLTHDPTTQSEYKKNLRKIDELKCTGEMKKRAERFAYYLFFCKHLKFPYLSEFPGTLEKFKVEHEEIGRDESIYNSIVEQMLNGEEVLKPGCMNLK